ncbi:hypothetical protein C0J52_09700, partial [Blattella germanica]
RYAQKNHNIILPTNIAYKIWAIVAVVIGPYVSFAIILYQASLSEYKMIMLAIGIFFDIVYLARPCIKLNLAYPNETGEFVRNKRSIRRKYFKSILGLAMDVITIPPLEVFAFLFPPQERFYYITVFRLNRLPRIMLLVYFFEERKNSLHISVFYMWLVNIMVVSTMVIHALACFRVVESCTVKYCQMGGIVLRERHDVYLKALYDIYQITSATTFATPIIQDTFLLFFFIFVAIFGQIATGFIISEVYTVLEMATFSLSEYIQAIKQMRTSLQRNNLSPPLIKRVWSHVCNLWDVQRGHHYPDILKIVPNYLRQKINLQLYGQHLMKVKFKCFSKVYTVLQKMLFKKLKKKCDAFTNVFTLSEWPY